jgi:GST-like protein
MIDLYFAATPNGLKIKLFFEETGLPYSIKIPAIVDNAPLGGGAPISLFESGAILLYLAEKSGRFMPQDTRGRAEVLQWLFWQVGGLGPMAGQIGHFNVYAPEPVPYAIDRYTREVARLYGVLNHRLADREFIAGDFSIADIAAYPWIVPHQAHGQSLGDFPHLERWFNAIAARPATVRTYEGVESSYARKHISEEERKHLFGHGEAKRG